VLRSSHSGSVTDPAAVEYARSAPAALAALEDRTCCLLANHGMIATGPNLAQAMWLAVELETIARQYYLALAIGGPVILPDAEIAHVKECFKGYGLRDPETPQVE